MLTELKGKKDEKLTKFVDFISNNSKKIIITMVILVGIILAAFGAFWFFQRDTIAVINGEKLTRQELGSARPQYERFYKRTDDQYSLNNLNDVVKNMMIEDLIVTTEAKKRNITLSQQELDEGYRQRYQGYSSEQEMLQVAKGSYGWDKEMITNSVRVSLLKEKLKDLVVKSYDLDEIYVRYDSLGDSDSEPGLVAAGSYEEINKIWEQVKNGQDLKTASTILEKDPTWGGNLSGYVSIPELSSANYKDTFHNREEEWTEISKLNQGEVSKVVKTGGGYFAFFKATKVRKGTFSSWEEFLSDIKTKNGIKPSVEKTAVKGGISKILNLFSGKANAHDGTFLSCRWEKSAQKGYIKDSVTGLGINGASISLSAINDNATVGHVHTGDGTNYPSNCSGQSDSDTSHITGYYRVGSTYTYVNGTGATNVGAEFLDCVYKWNKSISRTGYDTKSWASDSSLTNGQTDSVDYVLNPHFTLTVIKNGTGSGSVQTPAGGIACGTKCANTYTSSGSWDTTSLTATPNSDSVFAGFSGGGCSGTGTCSLTMDQDRTVYATFNKKTYSVNVTAGTGGTASANPTTVNYGGSSAIAASASSGYSFSSWSGDCAGQPASFTLSNITSNKSCTANFSQIIAGCSALPSETRELSCPAEYVSGKIYQQRDSSCPGPTWSGWYTTYSTCYKPPVLTSSCSISSLTSSPAQVNPGESAALNWDGSITTPGQWRMNGVAAIYGMTTGNLVASKDFTLTGVNPDTGTLLKDASGNDCSRTITVPVAVAKTISCSVTPVGGNVPLTAKFIYSLPGGGSLLKVNLNKDGSFFKALNPTGSPFFFSLDTPGKYTFEAVTDFGTDTCANSAITVNNPNDGSGGEVRP